MKRLLVITAFLLVTSAAGASVTIGDAWVRTPHPAQKITAGYMTIRNGGDKQVALIAIDSKSAKVVEMHEMKTVDGMMSMKKVDRIVIPPKGSVQLEPGGMHLMLIEFGTTEKSVTFTLEFDDGTKAEVKAPIRDAEDHAQH